MDENIIQSITTKLHCLWDKIELLKTSDPLQAQFLYEKYKKLDDELLAELPPPIPTSCIVDDQAVS